MLGIGRSRPGLGLTSGMFSTKRLKQRMECEFIRNECDICFVGIIVVTRFVFCDVNWNVNCGFCVQLPMALFVFSNWFRLMQCFAADLIHVCMEELNFDCF
mmetsp:Transcript_5840/g.11213  ORF Transcript_5840/g.11213 Transcript_5840/m.11213 type:complete len:101 (-) Transcript_5840:34-336(-)